jgi:hypothetical protein
MTALTRYLVIAIAVFLELILLTSPVLASVDGKTLGELLGISKAVPLSTEYVGGCILKTHGASTEYWRIAKSKVCSNKIENGFRSEKKYENFIQQGNGFMIFTVCTSAGFSNDCKGKPQKIPFDFAPVKYLGRCIMPVRRVTGYSDVFCVKGLPNKQSDVLLRSLIK